jgi:hypothetical protein
VRRSPSNRRRRRAAVLSGAGNHSANRTGGLTRALGESAAIGVDFDWELVEVGQGGLASAEVVEGAGWAGPELAELVQRGADLRRAFDHRAFGDLAPGSGGRFQGR